MHQTRAECTVDTDTLAPLHCISKFMFTTSSPLFKLSTYRDMQTLSKRVLLMHQYLTGVNVVLIKKDNLVANNGQLVLEFGLNYLNQQILAMFMYFLICVLSVPYVLYVPYVL